MGLYDATPEGLLLRRRVELDLAGPRTPVPALIGEQTPALVLPNDGDLTYTKIRLDPRSLATITDRLAELRDDLARALCWSATWEAVRDAALAARDYLPLVLRNIHGETDIGVVEQLLGQARAAILVYGDPAHRPTALATLAAAALAALRQAEPGSDRQLAWARAFIAAARSDEH
ncbi:MAG: ERAP1-like C-terminal domain-containing protein [Chloroflexi bacterium]|nr:ERAP1-like C-terminal domain-containing protein [Chloroflexota bacterium]